MQYDALPRLSFVVITHKTCIPYSSVSSQFEMASRSKNTLPVKYKSKRICEEKFDCDGSNASYECVNCGTRQCEHCEQLLHKPERLKFASHFRRKIEQLPCAVECALCPYKPAEYSCLECRTVICRDCNKEYHRGKLTGHRRTPLPKQKQDKEVCNTITQQSPTSEMNPSKSSPENCLPISPFLDSLSEPTPCEIKERQTTILTGDISSSSAGLNLIDELTLDSDFHSLTMTDTKTSLSSPDDNDIERDEFLSLESVSSSPSGPKSLEFLSGHFEGLERPTVAQSSAIAIPKSPESNVNRSAGTGGMTVTHRTTRTHNKPGSGRNVNKPGAVLGDLPNHGQKIMTSGNSPVIHGIQSKTEGNYQDNKLLDQTASPRHSEFFRSNSGSGEWTPPQPLSHSLESSGGRRRMEAIVKPVGSVKAVPSSPREKRGESQKKKTASPTQMKGPADFEAVEDEIDLVDPDHAKGFLLVDDSETLQVRLRDLIIFFKYYYLLKHVRWVKNINVENNLLSSFIQSNM